jgi:hypothetical protein
MRRLLAPVLGVALLASGGRARARAATESILGFHSEITVEADGDVVVRETIRVRCAGQQIKRGIYRDFPTLYRGPAYTRRSVPFEILEVLRDGRREAWHTGDLNRGVRVYIGRENVHLKPGVYTYTLAYRTGRQLGFFGDHDELYWNVTGNRWSFRIEKATARVTLPKGVPAGKVKVEGYTGPEGSKARDLTASVDSAGRANFSATRKLDPGSGLTIVVSWPKGHVSAPTTLQKLVLFLGDNAGLGLLGALVVFLYYFAAWARVGRDPSRGTIIPLFEPPKDISPAAARYVSRMGCDNKCVTAGAISAAVGGHLKLEEEDGVYTLRRTGAEQDLSVLPPEEESLVRDVAKSPGGELTLEQGNHTRIRAVIKLFEKKLKRGFGRAYFVRNGLWVIPGAVLSVITFLVAGFSSVRHAGDIMSFGFICVWLSGWTAGVTMLCCAVFGAWKKVITFRSPGGVMKVLGFAGNLFGAVFITAFSLPFLAGEVFGLGILVNSTSIMMVPLLLLLVFVNVVFWRLLRAYTRQGRRLMDDIEGFRMYLGTAEGPDRPSTWRIAGRSSSPTSWPTPPSPPSAHRRAGTAGAPGTRWARQPSPPRWAALFPGPYPRPPARRAPVRAAAAADPPEEEAAAAAGEGGSPRSYSYSYSYSRGAPAPDTRIKDFDIRTHAGRIP